VLRRFQSLSTPIRSSVKRLVGPRKPTPARVIARPSYISNHWHAVCVDAKASSCAEAHALRKRRFLSKEAPGLPLKGCGNPLNCPCTYRHHEDRRGKERRKGEQSFTSTQKVPTSERRKAKGRRSGDL
jgi:hypothetical protein